MHGPPHFPPPPPRKNPNSWWIIGGLLGVIALLLVALVVAFTLRSGGRPVPQNPSGHIGQSPGQAQPQVEAGTLADAYVGNSRNHTAEEWGLDGTASLKLWFTSKDPQNLQGRIEVVGRQVKGTGLFSGRFTGERIELTVHPTDGAPSFRLIGAIAADGTLSGALDVPSSTYVLAQSGEWSVRPQ